MQNDYSNSLTFVCSAPSRSVCTIGNSSSREVAEGREKKEWGGGLNDGKNAIERKKETKGGEKGTEIGNKGNR